MARIRPQLEALLARLMLLAGVVDGAGPERIPHALRRYILRLLRPAEALTRRLIVLMAREMEVGRHPGRPESVPGPSAPRKQVPDHASRVRDDGATTTHFQLFETLYTRRRRPRPVYVPGIGPRILCLDAPYPAAPVTDTAEDDASAAPLIARLRGLQAILENPEKLARRHARFLARKAALPPLERGRTSPVRPGWPPGYRSPHTPPWLKDALAHLTSEIRRGPPGLAAWLPVTAYASMAGPPERPLSRGGYAWRQDLRQIRA